MCVSIIDVPVFHLETIGGKQKLNIVDFGGQCTRSKRKLKYISHQHSKGGGGGGAHILTVEVDNEQLKSQQPTLSLINFKERSDSVINDVHMSIA